MASRPNMPQGGFMPQQQQAIRPPGVPVQNTMPPASVMQQQQQPTQQQPPQQPPHPRPLPPHHHLQQQGPPPTGGAAMPNSPAMFRPNQQQQIRPNISQAMAQGVRPPMPVGGTGQPFRPPGQLNLQGRPVMPSMPMSGPPVMQNGTAAPPNFHGLPPHQHQPQPPAPLQAGGSSSNLQGSFPGAGPIPGMSAPQTMAPPLQAPSQGMDGLVNQMGGMQMGPSSGPPPPAISSGTRSTRAKRVYASPTGSTTDIFAGQQHQQSMPSMPGMGAVPYPSQPQQPQPFSPQPGQPLHPGMNSGPVGSQMPTQPPMFGQPQPLPMQPPMMSSSGGPHPAMSPQGFQPPTFQPHPAQQAPTSTGGSVPQARSRIDPNQVPSPLVVHEQDQLQYDSGAYSTTCRQVPPLATTQYKAIDDGCSNPRFMRLTTYNFPLTDELANLTNVPLGLILQPLADLSHEEEPIEVVDFGESGPIRCNRCKAYLNPYFMWIEGGRRYVCNLCGFSNECPAEYFSNLDMNGRRMDYNRRPELRRGTIEFVATKEYCARPPRPVSYVFAIDISWAALQSGMVQVAVDAIKSILYPGETGNGLPAGAKVGIVSFDKSVQFYNLAAALDQPQMLVVADMEDVFVPLNDGFLVDPIESRTVIGNLLDTLPTIFETNRTAEVALGALAQATLGALKDLGGKLTIFQSMLPTFGPGALKNREDPKLLGTDKERMLYEPQEYFWRKLGQEFSSAGVCVDMFLFPTQYIDVATIGSLSALTGGEVWHYPNFDRQRDGRRFSEDLKRSVRRTFGYEALLRIRASNGLKITEHFGNFYMKNSTDVELAGLNSQTAIGVALKHDGKLDEKQDSALQAALLYTTADGHRRIRVLNMSIPNTGTLGNVFRFAEMDTTINFLIKAAIAQTVSANLKAVRDRLFEKCVQVLAAYRKHVAHASSPGQLILPESFKLYALYTLSVLRLKAFRGGPDLSTDIRVFHMRQLKSMGVAESVPLLYPRLMRIDTITPPLGELDDRNRVKLPPSIRVSAERLAGDGVYLAENGQSMVVWIGKAVVGDVVRNLFGVERVEDIDPKMKELPHLPNPLSQALQRILLYIQYLRPRYLDLRITRQGLDPLAEAEFHSTFMVEDAGVEMGYVDWLVNVHRQIQMEISNS